MATTELPDATIPEPTSTATHRIVCGVADHGSPAAVTYAAAEAERLGIELHLVAVIGTPPFDLGSRLHGRSRPDQPLVRLEAGDRLERAAALARRARPGLVVDHEVIETGWVAAGLARAAAGAHLLVIEQTRRSDLHRIAVGSTTDGLAYRSRVPLVSVPQNWTEDPPATARVTVGVQDVDEAPGLIAAGLVEAEARGAELVVVRTILPGRGVAPVDRGVHDDWIERAHAALDPVVEAATRDHPDVKVRIQVVDGSATDALLSAAETSVAVVVGRRHHERPWGSHLGPVVRRVLLDSVCPVVLPAAPSTLTESEASRLDVSPARGPVHGDVVVAVGHDDRAAALRFAVDEAARRGVGVHLVHVIQIPSADGAVLADLWQEALAIGRELLVHATAQVQELDEGVRVTCHLGEHGTLIGAVSEQADAGCLVVLQRRHLRRLRRAVTHSVSNGVAARVHVPVVVVPEGWRPGPDSELAHVVVGIKDLDSSGSLLEAAAAEAVRRGTALRVVHADWYTGTNPPLEAQLTGRWQAEARRRLEKVVASHRRAHPDLSIDVSPRTVPPARALTALDAGGETALIVVGRRNRRHGLGTHLGPVTRAVLEVADCPVMLVDTQP